MFPTLWLFAQKAGQRQPGILDMMFPIIIVMVLFYFILYLPNKKKEKAHKETLNSLKKGDKIITTSGIFGEIASIEKGTVILEIAPKTKIKIQQSAIAGPIQSSVEE